MLLAVGALLAEIFLQLSFLANLPPVDYLTLLDWIFLIAYIYILVVIVECIVIRKIYYNLMLREESIKDTIELKDLFTRASSVIGINDENSPPRTDQDNDQLFEEMKKNSQKIVRVKRIIRRVEKFFFGIYISSLLLLIFIISISVWASNNSSVLND